MKKITESQNYRGWKGPHEVIESKPLLKQVPYSRSLKKASRWVLNISREGDSIASLGSLFQGSVTDSKGVLPCVSMELPVLQFVLRWCLSGIFNTQSYLTVGDRTTQADAD